MKISSLYKLLAFVALVVFVSIYFIPKGEQINSNLGKDGGHAAEERPRYSIDEAEQAFYDKISTQKLPEIRSKSSSMLDVYADGKISGHWQAKEFLLTWEGAYGHRTIGSAYDKAKDIIYVVSHAGHIWRIDYDINDQYKTQWTSMNHSHTFMTTDRKEWFDILNYTDGGDTLSRMLRSYDNQIEYSNDEGRNWQLTEGVVFQETGNEGCVVESSNGNRAVVLAKSNDKYRLHISYDGINYTACDFELSYSIYDTQLLKPHHSDNVYVIARNKSNSKLMVFRMTPDSEKPELLYSPTIAVAEPTRVIGTYYSDKFYFYYIQENNIYYSDDEGASFSKIIATSYGNTDGNTSVRTVHPDLPFVLFRGYLDVYYSTNKGASFSNWGHKLGWDVHHMRMYQRKDGSYMHLIGKDFGVYISTKPELRTDYMSLNHTSPTQMAYDMTVSDNFGTAFVATQDRGSMAFPNTSQTSTSDVRTTDGLRVTLANNERSIWTWMYFGTLFHKANPGYGSSELKSINLYGSWTAGSMSAHPNAEKDAVVIAHGGSKLKIVNYDKDSKSISAKDHSFDFLSLTSQNLCSFGYSVVNPDIWYVGVKNGEFFYSTDGGASFKKSIAGALAKGDDQTYNYHRNQQIIKSSKLNENVVYFAGVKNAFYISTDHGQTFTNHANGLDVWRFHDFALSEDEKFIFAACAYAGAWVFSVDDDKWYPMNGANVPYVSFTSVDYTSSKGMVQFGTYGYGILDYIFKVNELQPNPPMSLSAKVISITSVSLEWEGANELVDSFIIQRLSDSQGFENVAKVDASVSQYSDTLLSSDAEFIYRVLACKNGLNSLPSNTVVATTESVDYISNSKWEVIYVSSEDDVNVSDKAIDNKTTTMWQSADGKTYPHEILIDFGSVRNIGAFSYYPDEEGVIKSFQLYATNDSTAWGEPISAGTWSSKVDAQGIEVFDNVSAQYIRFVAIEGFDSDKAGIAELQFYNGFEQTMYPPQSLSARSMSSSFIMLRWTNVSISIDGYIIERKAQGDFEEIARIPGFYPSYQDKDLEAGTHYEYRIIAYRNAERSELSQVVGATTSGTASLENVKVSDIKIYPNPFSDSFTLELAKPFRYKEMSVISSQGKLIYSQEVKSNKEVIRLDANLPQGIYFVRLEGEEGAFVRQVLKQ